VRYLLAFCCCLSTDLAGMLYLKWSYLQRWCRRDARILSLPTDRISLEYRISSGGHIIGVGAMVLLPMFTHDPQPSPPSHRGPQSQQCCDLHASLDHFATDMYALFESPCDIRHELVSEILRKCLDPSFNTCVLFQGVSGWLFLCGVMLFVERIVDGTTLASSDGVSVRSAGLLTGSSASFSSRSLLPFSDMISRMLGVWFGLCEVWWVWIS
jgi:hypothetical protein